MQLLLDTHAFLWWLVGDRRLPAAMRSLVDAEGTETFISAASIWEIATKHRLGKLPGSAPIAADAMACILGAGFHPLSVTVEHGQRAGSLPGPHRDPFDRMLVAQALVENLALVSNEETFDRFGVQRLW